jgi:hypothetical protein
MYYIIYRLSSFIVLHLYAATPTASADNKMTPEQARVNGEKVSPIQSLTARAQDLTRSVTWWNGAYVLLVALAVLVAACVFITQFVAIKRAQQLAKVQDDLIAEKDRQSVADSKDKDVKIAELGTKAAEAKLKAEGFERDIATANQKAAEADARAAEANLQLVKLKTTRMLIAAQQARIAEKLKAFSGTEFDVAIYNDPEVVQLWPNIEMVLAAAGWTQVHWIGGDLILNRSGRPVVGLVSVVGVEVRIYPDHMKEFWEPGRAFVSALNAEGINALALPNVGEPSTKHNALHILIGKKPQ